MFDRYFLKKKRTKAKQSAFLNREANNSPPVEEVSANQCQYIHKNDITDASFCIF